jgi:hypothetical protein
LKAPPSRLAGSLTLLLALAACSPPPEPAREPAVTTSPSGSPLHFAYETLDGKPLTSDALRGRITVVAFLTTYDFHSQAEARFLSSIARRHTPRLNAAALILEAAENRPLAEAFTATLALPYPVALADEATIAGEGPFAGLHHVPSIVILDREGREAYRHLGLIEEAALDQAIRSVEQQAR